MTHFLTVLWTVFILGITTGLTQSLTLSGTIIDAKTREPLPFATVGFKNNAIGTVSNGVGYFELKVPGQLSEGLILISYLGYTSVTMAASSFKPDMIITLKPTVLQLDELVIRPLTPEDYIKRVVKNFSNAYASMPFGTTAYYREKFMENENYLGLTEGVFLSYYPGYLDTLKNQHQLLLYREVEDPSEVQFMHETFAKKEEKKKRKAQKKGETYEEDEKTSMFEDTFGGPDNILQMDITKELEPFLDSTFFHKFKYSYGTPVTYRDRELLVILFESKGKVDHVKRKGKIYIDLETDAIASISYEGEAVIPIVVDPLLLAFGLTLSNPIFTKELRYQLVEDKWYPEYFYIHGDVRIKKIHFFDPNEKSLFQFEQLFKVSDLHVTPEQEIPEKKRFNGDKPLEEQVFNDANLSWGEINSVSVELVN